MVWSHATWLQGAAWTPADSGQVLSMIIYIVLIVSAMNFVWKGGTIEGKFNVTRGVYQWVSNRRFDLQLSPQSFEDINELEDVKETAVEMQRCYLVGTGHQVVGMSLQLRIHAFSSPGQSWKAEMRKDNVE